MSHIKILENMEQINLKAYGVPTKYKKVVFELNTERKSDLPGSAFGQVLTHNDIAIDFHWMNLETYERLIFGDLIDTANYLNDQMEDKIVSMAVDYTTKSLSFIQKSGTELKLTDIKYIETEQREIPELLTKGTLEVYLKNAASKEIHFSIHIEDTEMTVTDSGVRYVPIPRNWTQYSEYLKADKIAKDLFLYINQDSKPDLFMLRRAERERGPSSTLYFSDVCFNSPCAIFHEVSMKDTTNKNIKPTKPSIQVFSYGAYIPPKKTTQDTPYPLFETYKMEHTISVYVPGSNIIERAGFLEYPASILPIKREGVLTHFHVNHYPFIATQSANSISNTPVEKTFYEKVLDFFASWLGSSKQEAEAQQPHILKGVMIKGPHIYLPSDIVSSFSRAGYEFKEAELSGGNFTSELNSLYGRIDDKTLIIIESHGVTQDNHHIMQTLPCAVEAKGKMSLSDPVLGAECTSQTAYLFAYTNILTTSPLHPHLFSCYGGSAAADVMYLKDYSTVTAYSPTDNSLFSASAVWMQRQLSKFVEEQGMLAPAEIFYNMIQIAPMSMSFAMHLPNATLFQYNFINEKSLEAQKQEFTDLYHTQVDSTATFRNLISLMPERQQELQFLTMIYVDASRGVKVCPTDPAFRTFIRQEWELSLKSGSFATIVKANNTDVNAKQKIIEGKQGASSYLMCFVQDPTLFSCADVDFNIKDDHGWTPLAHFLMCYYGLAHNRDMQERYVQPLKINIEKHKEFIIHAIKATTDFYTPIGFGEPSKDALMPPVCLAHDRTIIHRFIDAYRDNNISLGDNELECISANLKMPVNKVKEIIGSFGDTEVCVEF